LRVVQRLPLSKFRFAVAEVVRRAERGEPTILTHYHRDVAAVVPVEMLPITDNPPPEKKAPASDTNAEEAKNQAS
jgi:prevent-host-death family protein